MVQTPEGKFEQTNQDFFAKDAFAEEVDALFFVSEQFSSLD